VTSNSVLHAKRGCAVSGALRVLCHVPSSFVYLLEPYLNNVGGSLWAFLFATTRRHSSSWAFKTSRVVVVGEKEGRPVHFKLCSHKGSARFGAETNALELRG
jgi:hypothetical protein